jgi:hypothetical protein
MKSSASKAMKKPSVLAASEALKAGKRNSLRSSRGSANPPLPADERDADGQARP